MSLGWCRNENVSLYPCFYGVKFIIELGKTDNLLFFLLLDCSCLESINREFFEPGVDSGILAIELALSWIEAGQMSGAALTEEIAPRSLSTARLQIKDMVVMACHPTQICSVAGEVAVVEVSAIRGVTLFTPADERLRIVLFEELLLANEA